MNEEDISTINDLLDKACTLPNQVVAATVARFEGTHEGVDLVRVGLVTDTQEGVVYAQEIVFPLDMIYAILERVQEDMIAEQEEDSDG